MALAATLAAGCSKEPAPSGDKEKEQEKATAVTGIKLSKTDILLKQGETFKITATALPYDADNRDVRWSSKNNSVVSVSASGSNDATCTVTAARAGSSVITVTSKDGSNVSALCRVTVNAAGFEFSRGKRDSVRFYSHHSWVYTSGNVPDSANNVMLYYYIPSGGADLKNKRVQFVMHGTTRNAWDYCDYWKADADKYDLVILAPCFPKKPYDNNRYQYGSVVDASGAFNDPENNTYRMIESIFDFFIGCTGSTQAKYNIWGHSAGGQFCHRFAQFAYAPRVEYIVAANPGNYTFPDDTKEYPYGWLGKRGTYESQTGVSRADIYAKKLILMLGTSDVQLDDNLPQTENDKAQGKNRYERGQNFFAFCQEDASRRSLTLNWKRVDVPGVAHNGGEMGKKAAALLYEPQ